MIPLFSSAAHLPKLAEYSINLGPIGRYADTILPMPSDRRFAEFPRIYSHLPPCVRPIREKDDIGDVDFADHCTLFVDGCGSACMYFCIVDRTSGIVYPGLWRLGQIKLVYARSSKLLEFIYCGWTLAAEDEQIEYWADCYIWENDRLNFLSRFKLKRGRSQYQGIENASDWQPLVVARPDRHPDMKYDN